MNLSIVNCLEKPFALPETALKNYAGVYDAGQVSVKDGYLAFRQSFKKTDRRLIPASADTFYVEGDLSTKLQFRTNPNGDPVEVVVSKIRCASTISKRHKDLW